MRFVLKRTTDWEDREPLKDKRVKRATYTHIDRRTLDTLEEVKHHPSLKKDWLTKGTNHREEKVGGCGIARDMGPANCWVIDIESLEELVKFQEKCKAELIIGPTDSYGEEEIADGRIEIYDDYRE